MEPSNNRFNASPQIPPSQEVVIPPAAQEAIEFVPKFKHIKEDLQNLFAIEVTSETSLSYPWVKDEFYAKVVEDFTHHKPFALDYMFEEGLLTKEDLAARNVRELKQLAIETLQTLKGPRLINAKKLCVETGILTEEEAGDTLYMFKR